MELVQLMKALGDETRIRILNLLRYGDLCVCELETLLSINQSNASRHLNKLNSEEVIAYYKKAQYVYYKLNPTILEKYPFINYILNEQLDKIGQCTEDIQRLNKYKASGMSCEDLKQGRLCF